MKNVLFLIIVSLICVKSYSQSFKILDAESHRPISYASIFYNGKGLYANGNGEFRIPNNIEDDTVIRIEAMGFEAYESLVSNLKPEVYLSPKIDELNEVVVEKTRETKVVKEEKTTKNFGSFPLGVEQEFVSVLFPNEKIKNSFFNKITIFFNKSRGFNHKRKELQEKRSAMRLNIYKYDAKSEAVFGKLFSSDVFFVNRYHKDEISVEINSYIPFYEEGIAIGVEFLGEVNEQMEFVEDDEFARGPALTERQSDDYEAESFLRYFLAENPAYKSFSEIFNEQGFDMRNLQLRLELVK